MSDRAERLAAKERAKSERAIRKQEAAARAHEERLAREATAASAYGHYLHVRDWARRISEATDHAALSLTAREQQVVAALAPFWDAAPEMIANLRRWCEPITGVRASAYEDSSSEPAKQLRRDLKRLYMEVGRELFVPEPSLLGGFGYDNGGEQSNGDTVRFFSALVALQDGAVLQDLRDTTGRRLVWEIGGGWGGFAYQLKTVCPHVTYLMTGAPEMFLLSVVYLMTAFPSARFRFYDASTPDALWHEWETADFIFVPEAALSSLRPPRLDLTLDVMSLREMTAERVRAHVQRAFELGSRYFYSLHPGGYANDDLPDVWKAIERLYWLQPVAPRVELSKVADVDYSHLVGWKRLLV